MAIDVKEPEVALKHAVLQAARDDFARKIAALTDNIPGRCAGRDRAGAAGIDAVQNNAVETAAQLLLRRRDSSPWASCRRAGPV